MKETLTILLCFGWWFASAQTEAVYERAWGTYFGGQDTYVIDSAIDNAGNSYLVGTVTGDGNYLSNFTTAGAHQPEYGGGSTDGFIAKFNPEGLLVWNTYFGGRNEDIIYSVAIDANGYVVVGGNTSSDGLATSGVHQTALAGGRDAFVAKFEETGALVWCTYYGGEQNEILRGLDTDTDGNVYIGGNTWSSSGIATPGTFHPEHIFVNPDQMGFIAKFDGNGLRQWGTYYGNNSYNLAGELEDHSTISAISVNQSGVFVTGEVYQDSTDIYYFGTPNSHQPTDGGAFDVYLSKFHPNNGQREWSTYYGGSSVENGILTSGHDYVQDRHNLVASENYVYLGGSTWSNNNIATAESFKPNKTALVSHFITKFNMQGNRMWGTYLGESNIAQTTIVHSLPSTSSYLYNYYPSQISLSLDKAENVIASGSTIMEGLASEGSYQETKNEDCNCTDGYTTKISSDGTSLIYGTYYGGEYNETAAKTHFQADDFYIAGQTQSYTDIATTGSFQEELNFLESTNNPLPSNAYLVKFRPPEISVDDIATSKSLIYPNPNNGSFFLNLNENYVDGELFLYDLNGRLVHNQNIRSISTHVQVSTSLKGVYLLKIVGGNRNNYHVQKIIIK